MIFKNNQLLALIPARGGSKGVPKKNMRLVKGKPLLAYTIETALNSSYIDTVYLSSDDTEILELGITLRAQVISRPFELASDNSTAFDVVAHFLSQIQHEILSQNPYIIYLQPTSPLRTSAHIDEACRLMQSKAAKLLMSVVKLNMSPYKSFKMGKDGRLKSLFSEQLSNTNRQTLPVVYYPNGAIYIFQTSEFSRRGIFPSDGSLPYIMSERDSLDIDSEDDVIKFEQILSESYG